MLLFFQGQICFHDASTNRMGIMTMYQVRGIPFSDMCGLFDLWPSKNFSLSRFITKINRVINSLFQKPTFIILLQLTPDDLTSKQQHQQLLQESQQKSHKLYQTLEREARICRTVASLYKCKISCMISPQKSDERLIRVRFLTF